MQCASRVIGRRFSVFAAWVAASGCGVLWPLEGTPRCEDYATVVQPVLTARCENCHGAVRAEAGYRLDSREGAIARRDDGSTRVSGTTPTLLTAAQGGLPGHEALPPVELATLSNWVTTCRAGPGPLQYHPRGWATPGDELSHGLTLRAAGYQTEPCGQCHGADLAGGTSRVSCQQCHAGGVMSCQTCHGTGTGAAAAPPRSLSGAKTTTELGVGAHTAHVTDGPLHLAYGCEVCHAPVTDVHQPGHFQRDGGAEDGIAEVVLAGAAPWDRSSATCTNSSCHRTAVDTAATRQAPRWTAVGQGEAACGTCHGLPPSTHSPEPNCGLCHPTNATDGGVLRGLHANGTVDIGRALTDGGAPGPATCASCHGDGAGTFADTRGRTDSSLPTVGLHQVHLEGRRGLSAPLACVDCHQQPTSLRDVGHVDSVGPAEVFPAVAGVAALARADGAQPSYTAATATCSNVYCHGGGTLAAMDTSPSRVTTLSWTSGLALTCGTCHGAPPNTAAHAGSTTLASCATCHAATVSALGNLVVTQQADGGLATTHLNGRVEKN